jgi:hypothetical protein
MGFRHISSVVAQVMAEVEIERRRLLGDKPGGAANAESGKSVEAQAGEEEGRGASTPAVGSESLSPSSPEGGNRARLQLVSCDMPSARSRQSGRPRVRALGRPKLIAIEGEHHAAARSVSTMERWR